MAENVGSKVKSFIMIIVRFELLCLEIGLWLGLLSSLTDFTNLCFHRYDFASSTTSTTYSVQSTVNVNGNANYNMISQTANGKTLLVPDPTQYGKWIKANFTAKANQSLQISASGTLSLCRAYVPSYNLQDTIIPTISTRSTIPTAHAIYYLNASGNRIPIPRVEEQVHPLTLIFDARSDGWRNLTEVYRADLLKVMVQDNINPNAVPASFSSHVTASDCAALSSQAAISACNRALNINNTQNVQAADCASLSANLQASCYAQATNPGGSQTNILTIADCNNMAPEIQAACIAAIPPPAAGGGATPPPNVPSPSGINVSSIIVTDSITNIPTTANCSQGQTTYSPICGRFSLWNGTQQYGSAVACGGYGRCSVSCNCDNKCSCSPIWDCSNCCDRCPCYSTTTWSTLPLAYLDNGSLNVNSVTSPVFMLQNYTQDPCANASTSDCNGPVALIPNKFWFTATQATGLQTRFDSQVYPTNPRDLGTNYAWAKILAPDTDPHPDQYTPRKIYSAEFGAAPVAYLQYRFHGANYSTTQTGGYVVQLMQTKCRRANGNVLSDSYENRGAVKYLILPSGVNPNDRKNAGLSAVSEQLDFGSNGKANINTNGNSGVFWFLINNNPSDYPDSIGHYTISIAGSHTIGSFTLHVLGPLFDIIRNRVYQVALDTFTNMVCYQEDMSASCANFFNYIRALLMIYVMLIGYRFLLGENIKHQDLVKSLAKIAVVAGLMNGSTFEFFHTYVFPLVTGFSDQMIANMSGFSAISSTNSVSNPFMFMDALMSKIFLNPTFLMQILTVMGMGLTGLLYFIIICISVIIFLIAIFRATAVYIMAMIATAFLIGLAPIFIVFILFEQTYYLFENWVKFLFKYMMEPVIVMAGIILLTQLFSLYIDQVLSYSLCWKCTLAFHVPFASLLPFPGLSDIPLFCIYWFGPWGLDPANDTIGMDLAMMVGLAIVAFSAYGYVEMASKMAERLCGAGGGPSSIGMGGAMAPNLGQNVLRKYGLDDKSMAAAKKKLKDGAPQKGPVATAKTNNINSSPTLHPSSGSGAGSGIPPTPAAGGVSATNLGNTSTAGSGIPPTPAAGGVSATNLGNTSTAASLMPPPVAPAPIAPAPIAPAQGGVNAANLSTTSSGLPPAQSPATTERQEKIERLKIAEAQINTSQKDLEARKDKLANDEAMLDPKNQEGARNLSMEKDKIAQEQRDIDSSKYDIAQSLRTLDPSRPEFDPKKTQIDMASNVESHKDQTTKESREALNNWQAKTSALSAQKSSAELAIRRLTDGIQDPAKHNLHHGELESDLRKAVLEKTTALGIGGEDRKVKIEKMDLEELSKMVNGTNRDGSSLPDEMRERFEAKLGKKGNV